jgi:DNA adenine methylase
MSYPGGKSGAGVYQQIINLMPPHDTYIEPFLGGAAIMRCKQPAAVNIGLDLDGSALRSAEASIATSSGAGSARFEFRQTDGIAFLEGFNFKGRELVYCDPPYVWDTRSGRRLYRFEMADAEHARLLRVLRSLPCAVMISGYWSELYAAELAGWNAIHFQAMTRGGRPATEWVWFNFPVPAALHDYRYLGANFRERERIKRRKQRWVNRLERMPELERRALLDAIAQLGIAGNAEGTRSLG